ncbi:hypothetical protein VTN96DRAFT_2318 [Rasamsonia emersonii]
MASSSNKTPPPGWNPSIEPKADARDLDGYIAALREKIAEGYFVEAYQSQLDSYLALKASLPPIDKDEPRGLSTDVY